MSFADPDELERLARRVEELAAEVRDECADFRRKVAVVEWQSAKAEEYREKCDAARKLLLSDAEDLDEAARLLREHARGVRARLLWAERMVEQLRDMAEDGARWTALQIAAARREVIETGTEMVNDVRDLADDLRGFAGEQLTQARRLAESTADAAKDPVGTTKKGIETVKGWVR